LFFAPINAQAGIGALGDFLEGNKKPHLLEDALVTEKISTYEITGCKKLYEPVMMRVRSCRK
jgi:hypothetical protein